MIKLTQMDLNLLLNEIEIENHNQKDFKNSFQMKLAQMQQVINKLLKKQSVQARAKKIR